MTRTHLPHRLIRAFGVIATAALAAGLAAPGAVHAEPTTGPTLTEALAALPVAAEHRDGYDRDLFHHWIDQDKDSCSTRQEVLIAEASLHLSSPACIPCC
ncbi:hypothetical protein [Glycomyces harbinensis]|uniref:Uncharacterized protein n=1 Tax=Glycomyces harbinensis TaxID=58114 RepID=A0A1G6VMZ9_9ACTN|nr:hypothetical protein [Glycomyces harbinensis]SDD54226.1 hypothetical protein SAMN05216270_1051 [Glycomyces harbinensis]